MVGAGTPGGGLRKWQLAMQKVTAANAQESTVMTAGGRVERRKSLAGGGHLKGGIKGLLEAAKIQKAKEEAEEEQRAAEEQQLALKNSVPLGWALGVFGPKNRMRIFLLKLVHHKVLGLGLGLGFGLGLGSFSSSCITRSSSASTLALRSSSAAC